MRRIALVGTIAALALPVAQASAADPLVPIAVAPLNPVSGQVLTTSNDIHVPLQVRWSPPASFGGGFHLFAEVDNQNIKGQDGTLADDSTYQVGSGLAYQGDADPTLWTGTLTGFFPRTPGTYYLQFHAYGANADCGPLGGNCVLASEVFTFTVAAPAPPAPAPVVAAPAPVPTTAPAQPSYTPPVRPTLPLNLAARRAKSYVKSHRNARNPSAKCRRVSRVNVVCAVKWTARGHKRSAQVDVIRDQDGTWAQFH
jgi:hypothetical protein